MEKTHKFAVIGAGISGLAVADLLQESRAKVRVFERCATPGGLIRCRQENDGLYHMVGGHVFNSRRQNVMDWFWARFERDSEFIQHSRNAVVIMPDNRLVKYPIEDHCYMLPDATAFSVVKDLIAVKTCGHKGNLNFDEFLRNTFGETLYREYFRPYNEKIWRQDLTRIPLSWLEGKLPMPSVEEILYNNICRVDERQMVHSSFYYPRRNGSQFIADRLASRVDVTYNAQIREITAEGSAWLVDGERFDAVVFCGSVKDLPSILGSSVDLSGFASSISRLACHGTTSVFCRIKRAPYSWAYLPDSRYAAHRIILTGNFSEHNNRSGLLTATVEFTDAISRTEIDEQLRQIPLSPHYISHTYTPCTYPIQDPETRSMIRELKTTLRRRNIHLLGRFAEWEYYNMDSAIDAAMTLVNSM